MFFFLGAKYDAMLQFGRESSMGLTGEERGRSINDSENGFNNNNNIIKDNDNDLLEDDDDNDDSFRTAGGENDRNLSGNNNDNDNDNEPSGYINIRNVKALLALSPEPNSGVHLVEARPDQQSFLNKKQYKSLTSLLDYVRRDDFYLLDECPTAPRQSSTYLPHCECPSGYMGLDCSIKSKYLWNGRVYQANLSTNINKQLVIRTLQDVQSTRCCSIGDSEGRNNELD